jgi:rsbT co-antagonist protein RsbR
MVVKVATVGEARYSVGTVVDVTVQAELAAGLRPDVASAPLPATPVLRVAAGVLVVPLVGHFHADRVRALTTDVLAAIGEQRAHALILDVTGLLDADARVADYLPRTADAARLLGARCIVAGVSPALAQVLVAQAGSLGRLATAASLEDAVKMAQDRR